MDTIIIMLVRMCDRDPVKHDCTLNEEGCRRLLATAVVSVRSI